MNNSPFKLVNKALILLIIYLTLKIVKLLNVHVMLFKIIVLTIPLIIGFIISWLFYPLYKWLCLKRSNKLSIIIIILLYIGLILSFFLIIGPNLINSYNNLNSINNKYVLLIKDNLNIKKINLIKTCMPFVKCFSIFLLSSIFGFYFLYRYDDIFNKFFKRLKPKYRSIINDISFNMRLYLKGLLIDTLVLFSITFILFILVGLKSAFLFAFICALTNIVPFIGPYIGGIPAVMFALNISFKMGVYTFIIIVITQILESNLINPYIMSKCIKINPFIILYMVLFMGGLFGPVGMILSMPTLIILKILLNKC